MENKPYISWKYVRNNLNISPEQELEIQFEKDIIEAVIKARKKINFSFGQFKKKLKNSRILYFLLFLTFTL